MSTENIIDYTCFSIVQENLNIARKTGYSIVGSFIFLSESWWTDYYNPIMKKLPSLKEKYEDNEEKL